MALFQHWLCLMGIHVWRTSRDGLIRGCEHCPRLQLRLTDESPWTGSR